MNHARIFKLGDEILLTIESLAVGGAGVARYQGFVFFVDQTAPEDVIIAKITELKKNFGFARLIKLESPGPSRRIPPCSVAETCGGCNWQHIHEIEQLNQKKKIVISSLKKQLRDLNFNSESVNIYPSPISFHYRNRVQLKFKSGKMGYFARGTHDIVNTENCLLIEKPLMESWQRVRTWAQKLAKNDLFKFELRLNPDGSVFFAPLSDQELPPAFAQVNRFQNEELISKVITISEKLSPHFSRIIDLYCGSGNFTFPLAQKFSKIPVFGTELNSTLIDIGRKQVNSKGLNHQIQFHTSDVESFLKKFKIKNDDLVIIDPPRTGCSENIVRSLARSRPQHLIYISCNPVALARDLKWFFSEIKSSNNNTSINYQKSNAEIKSIDIYEMFPQTDHVETILHIASSQS